MLVQLLHEEMMDNFPPSKEDRDFELHCSPAFRMVLNREFFELSTFLTVVVDGNEVDLSKAVFSAYRLPTIGHVQIIEDREQGYELKLKEQ